MSFARFDAHSLDRFVRALCRGQGWTVGIVEHDLATFSVPSEQLVLCEAVSWPQSRFVVPWLVPFDREAWPDRLSTHLLLRTSQLPVGAWTISCGVTARNGTYSVQCPFHAANCDTRELAAIVRELTEEVARIAEWFGTEPPLERVVDLRRV